MTGVAELKLLGSFALHRADGERVPITSKRSIALLALLALSRSGGRRRTWLQAQLWGTRGDAQGRASLRRELSNLRVALLGHGLESLIASNHGEVRLDLARIAVDARLDDGGEPEGRAAEGELLEGLDIPGEEQFEDWLRTERARRSGGGITGPGPFSNACIGVAALACGGDVEETSLAAGIADELAREVARLSGRAILREHRSPLRPRFRIDGQVRRAGSDVRAAVRLFDEARGGQIWAERFDGALAEGFAFETRIASLVAPVVAALIAAADGGRGRPARTAGGVSCATGNQGSIAGRGTGSDRKKPRAGMRGASGGTVRVGQMVAGTRFDLDLRRAERRSPTSPELAGSVLVQRVITAMA